MIEGATNKCVPDCEEGRLCDNSDDGSDTSDDKDAVILPHEDGMKCTEEIQVSVNSIICVPF